MIIRHGNYTKYKNHEVELLEARHEMPIPFTHFILKWTSEESCPLDEFEVNHHGSKIFILDRDKVDNAFDIVTKAIYKGKEFNVEPYFGDNIHLHLMTNDEALGKQLEFYKLHDSHGKPYYLGEINKTEIEKVWEERTLSNYNLPFPNEVEKFKEIKVV